MTTAGPLPSSTANSRTPWRSIQNSCMSRSSGTQRPSFAPLRSRPRLDHAPRVSPPAIGATLKNHTNPLPLDDGSAAGPRCQLLHIPADVDCEVAAHEQLDPFEGRRTVI